MNYKDIRVANAKDLKKGEMRQVSVEDNEILLARVEDGFFATVAHCTHYGAPLVKGILNGERVICPWHNACFGVKNGKLEEPPALDALPHFPVRVEGEDLVVKLPEKISSQRIPEMGRYNPQADNRTFVILGAGAAGSAAAETLRQAGFEGRVVMLTKEDILPYDRTALSKKYLQNDSVKDSLILRSLEFYNQWDIEVYSHKSVTKVEPVKKTITFEDDTIFEYDALLVATGGKPRNLKVPGADLDNIFTLRKPEDADKIVAVAENAKTAVVVGSSFIGMEAASSLAQRDIKVTVVAPGTVPFEKILGGDIGATFRKLHESNGVSFRMGTKVKQFEGKGKVETAVLENGESLNADLVIVGIGVEPVTDFLQEIELNEKDGSVIVDEYLQAADNLYVAGDIARFPYAATGELTRIEHWRLAQQHGRVAARNMIGEKIKFASVPFFWSGQFGVKLRYAGHAEEWDDIIIQGNLDEQEFLAFYVKDNQVLAVAGSQHDKDIAAITELMRLQQMPSEDEVRKSKINWVEKLTSEQLAIG
ncbi:NAD(FAD)-dependent dehydrogenase [Rivularia sp. PCC 7116]|uniref:FAD-dependent oxidoreductase n=1 Tax=Rivularia sp. PCC 7116 TaxID=373994 RepID=UPI00029EFEDA|nr:FAD-dependent oxidoreductase [Rivularia sp. PCC 7116]AFY55255.1 NAD(FAD)-dependent dehydrogenase [Rivularia sp. PCC 7116]